MHEQSDTKNHTIGEKKNILLGRYHDGTAKNNWGGRATSLALAGILAAKPDVANVAPLNGGYITQSFGDFTSMDKIRVRVKHQIARAGGSTQELATRPFEDVESFARRLLSQRVRSDRLTAIVDAVDNCDEFWMNGEGDFILGYSGTLWRTLLIMEIAQIRRKPVFLVNSILDNKARSPTPESVESAVGRVVRKCEGVFWRDPESKRISDEIYGGVVSTWLPDALFSWSRVQSETLPSVNGEAYTPWTEGLPLTVQRLLTADGNLVVISGSSTMRSGTVDRRRNLSRIVVAVRSAGLCPVLVATSDEDSWLERAADEMSCPYVPARVPLIAGLTLLARAAVFVSGRYHPSILAHCVGTPSVIMASNSHKSMSVQQVFGDDPRVYDTFSSDPQGTGLIGRILESAAEGAAERNRRVAVSRNLAAKTYAGLTGLPSEQSSSHFE
ncbi:MAG: hypothetical protein C0482_10445 [Gordonia sp.]|nr:hypothetical protein [Gordonia sp. (in: high G+C Gram-positive bacteria)]